MESVWWALATILIALFAVRGSRSTVVRPVGEMPKPGPEVRALINEKRNVAAIKLYRKQTASSLMEAKQVIEHYT